MRCSDPRFDAHLHLVERAVRLAGKRGWPIDSDDARQAALLGLFQACQRVPEGAEHFVATAWMRIKGSVVDEARRSGLRRGQRIVEREELAELAAGARALGRLPVVLFDDEGSVRDMVSPLPSPEDMLLQAERRRRAHRRIRRLETRRADVIARVIAGEKHKDIARSFGVSEPRISQLYGEAVASLALPQEVVVGVRQEKEDGTLRYLATPGHKTGADLAARFGISRQAAHVRLAQLRERGLISDRRGDYSLTSKGLAQIGLRSEPAAAPPPPPPPVPNASDPAMRDLVESIVRQALDVAGKEWGRRVSELEQENASLRAQIQKGRERMGFALEALGGAS